MNFLKDMWNESQEASDGKTYGLQTLKDNVCLLDEETVNQINIIVVEALRKIKNPNVFCLVRTP